MRNYFKFQIVFISLLIISACSSISAEGEIDLDHKIIISKNGDNIDVKENLQIIGENNDSYDDLSFWISSDAKDVSLLVNNNEVNHIKDNDNFYLLNISELNISKDSMIRVTISYQFDSSIEEFKKTLTYNTTKIFVEFNENRLYSGENLRENTFFTLTLYEPTESPLSGYILVSIIILIAFLAITTVYSFRRKKTVKIKDIAVESEELLSTKKTLLLSSLKDIEKQHRAKHISDNTYNKLKTSYKQQAVEVMKKIDDLK